MTLATALDLNESATISEAEATVLALKQKMETGESARVEELASECSPSAKSGPAPQMRKVARSKKYPPC
ncbi:MAG: hypothetical protein G3M70_04790 [Candidatus Nitronauta litoralis]|uniref:Uncharacterized protein n=1 Tax=Candidatus Nitronauta litoralis TaxID=2705533 RepID=A0A7T0BUK7_9BACT|nr:MAG: hypothetical protein G3M70_04790 [Candidatus Nitronauta litoralis]